MQGFFTDMVASTRASIETLKDRLRATTLRERALLGVLALGAAVYAPVAALEWRTTQADRYIDALSEQSTARLTANAARRIAAGAADRLALDELTRQRLLAALHSDAPQPHRERLTPPRDAEPPRDYAPKAATSPGMLDEQYGLKRK